MTYDEAVDVVGLLLSAFPAERAWQADEIRSYAQGIERLDAAVATKTVVRAQATVPKRPNVSDFLSIARSVEAGMAAPEPPKPYERPNPRDLPAWVGRWVVARKNGDFRRFPEQGDWGDPRLAEMPADAWVEEAKGVTLDDALGVVGGGR